MARIWKHHLLCRRFYAVDAADNCPDGLPSDAPQFEIPQSRCLFPPDPHVFQRRLDSHIPFDLQAAHLQHHSHLPRSWDYVIGDDTNGEQYYYPLEWEIQLISSLKAGNHSAANRILEELRKENRKLKPLRSDGASAKAGVKLVSMILDTFLRVISELSLNDRLFMEDLDVVFTNESFDHKWECLLSICERICTLASREKESSAVSCLGRELLDYVNDHFRSSDLCLKTLGDRFNLSIQSISKLFKTAADDTFYNYLYHKRMEYACHLLRTTSDTMQSIANQVGYENEFSFKRAFIRYTGIRPKDYMENNRS